MIKKILIMFILISSLIQVSVYATDEIISSQMETLNISSIINEGKEYTKDVFPDIDLQDLLNSSLTGKIDNTNIFKDILKLFSKEIVSTITVLRKYFNSNSNT
jgi:hypothetical protein